MALFDPGEQRMCVRVVYDGAAGAGKTTNLRQLGSLFAAQRATEVTSPAELRGRTLYLDWMQIAAGVVCGFPLLCQVISVPGQVAFTERRRQILTAADVVVYVCESSRQGAERAGDALRIIDEIGESSGVRPPIVVQANKQDVTGALAGKALVEAIGRGELPVIEAIATDGIGVVDTFVSAVRTVARSFQERMERGQLRIPVRAALGMKQVLAEVAKAPIDPFGAAELLLEEASAALVLDRANALASLGPTTDPPPPPIAAAVARGRSAAPPADSSTAAVAPLPNADVPTGFIWPAHTGRATLRKLATGGGLTGSVRLESSRVEKVVDDHVLSTAERIRFDEPDVARQALVRAARERTQLGPLLVSDTVLVVQPSSDGSSWLWTVTPKLGAVTDWLPGPEARSRVEALAVAISQAVVVGLRQGVGFSPTLDAFGIQNGALRYRGDLEASEPHSTGELRLLLEIGGELLALGLDVEGFVGTAERELARRLEPAELLTLSRAPAPEGRGGPQVVRELLGDAITRLASRVGGVVAGLPSPWTLARDLGAGGTGSKREEGLGPDVA